MARRTAGYCDEISTKRLFHEVRPVNPQHSLSRIRSLFFRVFSLTLVFGLMATAVPAGATPVCPDDKALCGGRIFPEADNSIDFVQHDETEYMAGIQALEEAYP